MSPLHRSPVTLCVPVSPEEDHELFVNQVKDLKWKNSPCGPNLHIYLKITAFHHQRSRRLTQGVHSIYKKINFYRSKLWPVKIHASSSLNKTVIANVFVKDSCNWLAQLMTLLSSMLIPKTISFLTLGKYKLLPLRSLIPFFHPWWPWTSASLWSTQPFSSVPTLHFTYFPWYSTDYSCPLDYSQNGVLSSFHLFTSSDSQNIPITFFYLWYITYPLPLVSPQAMFSPQAASNSSKANVWISICPNLHWNSLRSLPITFLQHLL